MSPLPRVAVLSLRDRHGVIQAHAIIDAADLDDVGRWTWCLNPNGYAWRNSVTDPDEAAHVYLHRYLMDRTPGDGMYVDHINRDRLDNRRGNLRVLTPAQAAQNKPSLKGRYRGVNFDASRGKWQATAQLDKRRAYLGRFDTEDEAHEAVVEWRRANMPWAVEDIA